MFKRILVPVDGTTHSHRAVKFAAALARRDRASLTIFHASPAYTPPVVIEAYVPPWPTEREYRGAMEKSARKVLDRAARLAPRVKVDFAHECSNAPAAAILDAARKAKSDCIVMTTHGRTGLERLVLGSQAQKVIARSRIPVLVVK